MESKSMVVAGSYGSRPLSSGVKVETARVTSALILISNAREECVRP